MVQLEQLIISGLKGTKNTRASNTEIVKQVSQISKELQPVDYLRLLMVYFITFELTKKDKDTMLKSISKSNFKDVITNLGFLDENVEAANKFERRAPEMNNEEFHRYLQLLSEAQFDILKCEARICKLIR